MKRADLDEFVAYFRPKKCHLRKPTWDKVNLDIFWLKDKSLEDGDDLPKPNVLAEEIADDLETALEQFQAIAGKLKSPGWRCRWPRFLGEFSPPLPLSVQPEAE